MLFGFTQIIFFKEFHNTPALHLINSYDIKRRRAISPAWIIITFILSIGHGHQVRCHLYFFAVFLRRFLVDFVHWRSGVRGRGMAPFEGPLWRVHAGNKKGLLKHWNLYTNQASTNPAPFNVNWKKNVKYSKLYFSTLLYTCHPCFSLIFYVWDIFKKVK